MAAATSRSEPQTQSVATEELTSAACVEAELVSASDAPVAHAASATASAHTDTDYCLIDCVTLIEGEVHDIIDVEKVVRATYSVHDGGSSIDVTAVMSGLLKNNTISLVGKSLNGHFTDPATYYERMMGYRKTLSVQLLRCGTTHLAATKNE